ncbi:MAG: hypothetical protein WBC04_12250, partial [Candidatus Acidiferrales bacterium]
GVVADFHSIRYLFAGKALQQKLHRLLLPSREVKLLGDPREGEKPWNASLEQQRFYGRLGRAS